MNLERFFSAEELAQINEAVAEAERATAGEIVPVVVSRSSDYREITYLGGIIGAVLVYFATVYVIHVDTPSRVLITLAAGYILGALLTFLPPVARLLIGRSFSEEEAWKRAVLEFQIHKVGETAAQTGILICVSLLERTVVVYGDQTIAAKLTQKDWNEVRNLVVRGLRKGRAAEGLIAGITRCGEILAEHFPIQADDRNELPNRLVFRP